MIAQSTNLFLILFLFSSEIFNLHSSLRESEILQHDVNQKLYIFVSKARHLGLSTFFDLDGV